MEMNGEYIVNAETVIGYIHRMHEKMGELKTYPQFLMNLSRMDYLGAMGYCHGHVLVVEKACGIEVPERAEYIRAIMVELNRIASHLFWFGAFVMDRITSYNVCYTKLLRHAFSTTRTWP